MIEVGLVGGGDKTAQRGAAGYTCMIYKNPTDMRNLFHSGSVCYDMLQIP